MKPHMMDKIKLVGISFVVGAVTTMLIGFLLGGWTTPGTVKKMSEKAVFANHVELCVAQFASDQKYNENLEELSKLEENQRIAFIQMGGWDKMPGQKEADADVAKECTWKMEEIMRK